MSDEDPLDSLLSSTRKALGEHKSTPSPPAGTEPDLAASPSEDDSDELGVDPLELVDMPAQHRNLLIWISRHKGASRAEIQQALDIPDQELDEALGELVKEHHVRVVIREGVTCYRTPLRGQASRRLRGFPDELWKKAGLDDE